MGQLCRSIFRGPPPDGGWSWVVLFASFMNIVMMDGIAYTFGIFFTDLLSYFHSYKGTTSWASAGLNGVYLSIGPLVSALVTVYGCRRVAVTGSVICAAGLFLSTFCPNIESFIFVYAVLGGIGFGLSYLPTILVVNFYFKKRRAFATGIAVCGSGVGTFIFAPLREKLLEVYGWKGASWILAGMMLNCVIFSSLYRPMESGHLSAVDTEMVGLDGTNRGSQNIDAPNDANDEVLDDGDDKSRFKLISSDEHDLKNQIYDEISKVPSKETIDSKNELTKCMTNVNTEIHQLYDPSKQNIAISSYIIDGRNPSLLHCHTLSASADAISADRGVYGVKTYSGVLQLRKLMKSVKSGLCNSKVMRNPAIISFGFARFLYSLGFMVPIIFIPDMARDLTITSRDAAFLISIIGISSTIGRVAAGFIADRPCTDSIILTGVLMILLGIPTIILPNFAQYNTLAGYCAIYGSLTGSLVCLCPQACIRLSGIECLSATFGIINMFGGLASFIGGPIAGSIADYTGNYNASFYFSGASFILGGLGCLPLGRISKMHNDENKTSEENEINKYDSRDEN